MVARRRAWYELRYEDKDMNLLILTLCHKDIPYHMIPARHGFNNIRRINHVHVARAAYNSWILKSRHSFNTRRAACQHAMQVRKTNLGSWILKSRTVVGCSACLGHLWPPGWPGLWPHRLINFTVHHHQNPFDFLHSHSIKSIQNEGILICHHTSLNVGCHRWATMWATISCC